MGKDRGSSLPKKGSVQPNGLLFPQNLFNLPTTSERLGYEQRAHGERTYIPFRPL